MLIKWNVTSRGWSGWRGVRDIRRGGRVREYWSGATGHRVPPTALPSEMTWESKPEREARHEQITDLLLRDHKDQRQHASPPYSPIKGQISRPSIVTGLFSSSDPGHSGLAPSSIIPEPPQTFLPCPVELTGVICRTPAPSNTALSVPSSLCSPKAPMCTLRHLGPSQGKDGFFHSQHVTMPRDDKRVFAPHSLIKTYSSPYSPQNSTL